MFLSRIKIWKLGWVYCALLILKEWSFKNVEFKKNFHNDFSTYLATHLSIYLPSVLLNLMRTWNPFTRKWKQKVLILRVTSLTSVFIYIPVWNCYSMVLFALEASFKRFLLFLACFNCKCRLSKACSTQCQKPRNTEGCSTTLLVGQKCL